MIFATCGSSHLPFDRMMRALAALPIHELHVQYGPATPPSCAWSRAYLPFDGMLEKIEAASVVISHAGVGSIICALRAGHVPILFPRLERYAETVDDHQAELARALAERGMVRVAWTAEELVDGFASAPPRAPAAASSAEQLAAAVRTAIHGPPAAHDRGNPIAGRRRAGWSFRRRASADRI
ncbi:MAG: hypothetical protein LC685_00375 [Actinobacteria bacterium]|nr:hypothetical protein [Actinomycetota bacterium]